MSTPTRSTWTTDTVRAVDLEDNDSVLIDGAWREVLDVWNDDDDPAAQFGDDHPMTLAILDKVAWCSPSWTAVRYVHEETSTPNEVDSRLHFFRCRDLVQVQREVKPEPGALDALDDVLDLMSDLDLRGALRAGTELWAETGDPQDVLSSSQRDNLDALRRHFTSLDAL
ncbi:hypothetical protein [Streptomyces kronopolitis]|uniref:hypothetical protein n=1 Tax=Streptomyces kronopolitis TaxID=1612435 RepID=UPI003D994BFA